MINNKDHLDQLKSEEDRDIIEWLSPLNYWTKQNDIFDWRHEGTGEWLIRHPEFEKWIEGDTQVLWCPGNRISNPKQMLILAGVGKTILA